MLKSNSSQTRFPQNKQILTYKHIILKQENLNYSPGVLFYTDLNAERFLKNIKII